MAVLQLQLRNDTSSNWTTANPTLLEGEFGLETNTGKYKIGDGSTAWNSLSYGGSYLSGQPMGARMTFSTTTTAGDPGNGFFRLNNATWGTVTRIYIDLLDTGGTDLTTWIDSWDDSTSTLKGHLHFTEIGGTGFMTFAVTAVTTQTGYREITVSPLAGSVPANNSNWGVLFAPAGYKGDTGTTGSNGSNGTNGSDLAGINPQTASYTLVLSDASKLVTMDNASANNLTVPPNASVAIPINTQILVQQIGAGQTTIVAGSGVTINSYAGLKLMGQWAMCVLIKTDTNTWTAGGHLIS